MSNIFKSMKAKKKRAVDPNAPPRPNLLSHDKKLRDMTATHDMAMDTIRRLHDRVQRLESKLTHQTSYLQALHNKVQGRR